MMELHTWEELAEYIEKTAISLPGYEQYCQHKHEIKLRAKHWAKSGVRYWAHKWHYPDRKGKTYKQFIDETKTAINADLKRNRPQYDHRYAEINLKRQAEFYERLTTCIKAIEKLPDKVGDCISLLQQKSQELFGIKFSVKTLKKPEYRKHWHVKYRPRRLPSAPFVQLKAIALIGDYLQNTIQKIQNTLSSIIQSQSNTIKDIQIKPPLKAVTQTPKIDKKETRNLDKSIVSKIAPTMKCFPRSPLLAIKVRISVVSAIAENCKNLLLKLTRRIEDCLEDLSKSEIVEYCRIKEILRLSKKSTFISFSLRKYHEIQNYTSNNLIYIGTNRTLFQIDRMDKQIVNDRIITGVQVQLSEDIHSTQLRDNLENALVYIQANNSKPVAVRPEDLLIEKYYPKIVQLMCCN